MSILVVNAGSSTVKLSLFDGERLELLASETYETTHSRVALSRFLNDYAHTRNVRLVGHRIVHGGTRFQKPLRIDDEVWKELRAVSELAPLHNPAALQALEEARKTFPQAAHVAIFDTAFFARLPERALIYPLPHKWFTDWGIRRFGFHGINHEYCARRAAEMVSTSRMIICHLGGGCSATAIYEGNPIATTMGFTPMEGLMMATRAGSIDPGILIHLSKEHGLTIEQIEHALNTESGLLGVSGLSSDYRVIEKAASEGNQRASLACQLFEDRIISAIGSLSALLGGLDTLVFTGGTGEHRSQLRASVCERLQWIGIQLHRGHNANAIPDIDIAAEKSAVHVLVIRAREDLMIAQAAQKLFP